MDRLKADWWLRFRMFRARGSATSDGYDVFMAAACLLALGWVMMGSIEGHASTAGPEENGATAGLLRGQVLGTGVGVLLMWAVSQVDYRRWHTLALPLLGTMLALLLIEGMGVLGWGTARGLPLGPWRLFQPAFLAGPALVLFMAWWYGAGETRSAKLSWAPIAAVVGLAGLLFLVREPGFALLVLLTGWTLMIRGKAGPARALLAIVLPVAVLLWGVSRDPIALHRFAGLFASATHSEPACVPIFVLGLRSGGWFGAGPGNGTWTRWFLQEASGGLVTATIGEELGRMGLLTMTGLFAVIVVSGIRISIRAPDRFGSLLAAGIVSLLAFQVLLNLAVVTGLIPIRALPLPLVSHGVAALIMPLISIGALWSIARTSRGLPKPLFSKPTVFVL